MCSIRFRGRFGWARTIRPRRGFYPARLASPTFWLAVVALVSTFFPKEGVEWSKVIAMAGLVAAVYVGGQSYRDSLNAVSHVGNRLKSRKFWMAVLGAVSPVMAQVVTGEVGWPLAVFQALAIVMTYAVGQGVVDGKAGITKARETVEAGHGSKSNTEG